MVPTASDWLPYHVSTTSRSQEPSLTHNGLIWLSRATNLASYATDSFELPFTLRASRPSVTEPLLMPDDFQIAYERARKRIGEEIWDHTPPRVQAEAIYAELRAIDAERAAGRPPTTPS